AMSVAVCVAGSAATALVGGVWSKPLHQIGVASGSFTSNTIDAPLQIDVPLARSLFGMTVNETEPSPSGALVFTGRKPASASVVSSIVAGSTDVNVQCTRP